MCYLGDNLLSPPTHNNSVYHKPFIVNPLRMLLSLKNLKLETISLVSQQFALRMDLHLYSKYLVSSVIT